MKVNYFNSVSNYIMENAETTADTFPEVARDVYDQFIKEVYSDYNSKRYFNFNEYQAFTYWCGGLPSILDTCYLYNRSAREDLKVLLPGVFLPSESKCQDLLTTLIYEVLKLGVSIAECEVSEDSIINNYFYK